MRTMVVTARELPAPLGDSAAFTAFYEAALPKVYSYFFHRCGGRAAVAEDLAQETFLAAVAEIRKRRPVEVPLAWVLGIAKHKLVDHYRREARGERDLAAARADPVGEHVAWSGEESRGPALEALAALPARQRAALVLRYLDGLSVPEVAEALGVGVEAAESVLARGRESFRRLYREASDE